MSLRLDNDEKLAGKVNNNTEDQVKDKLDTAASYIPGQSKTRDIASDNAATPHLTHDTGRQGGLDAFKPASEQTTGEFIQNKLDQAASAVLPKSNAQEARDTVTPGHHSDPKDQGKGIVGTVTEAVVGAKDAVVNALGGNEGSTNQAAK